MINCTNNQRRFSSELELNWNILTVDERILDKKRILISGSNPPELCAQVRGDIRDLEAEKEIYYQELKQVGNEK